VFIQHTEDAVVYLAECRSVWVSVSVHFVSTYVRTSYPVPNCSTFVKLSCNRLFAHASSSCLPRSCQRLGSPHQWYG